MNMSLLHTPTDKYCAHQARCDMCHLEVGSPTCPCIYDAWCYMVSEWSRGVCCRPTPLDLLSRGVLAGNLAPAGQDCRHCRNVPFVGL